MDKFWERYITSRPANSKGAFEAFAAANRDPEPRNMADGGRIGFEPGGSVASEIGSDRTIGGLTKKERIAQGLEKGRVSTKVDIYTKIVNEHNKAIQRALDTKDASKLPKPFAQTLKANGLKDGTYSYLARNSKQIPKARDVSINRFNLANDVINDYNNQLKFMEKEAVLKKANFTPEEIKVLSVQTVKKYPYRLKIADKAQDKVRKAFVNFFSNPEYLESSYNDFYNPRELLSKATGLNAETVSRVNLKDIDPQAYEVYKRLGNADIQKILDGDVTKSFFGSSLEDLKKYINEEIAEGKKPFQEFMDAGQAKAAAKRKERVDKAKILAGKSVADINEAQKEVVKLLNNHYKKYPEELLGNTKLRNILDLTLEDGEIVKKNKYVSDDDFKKLIKERNLFTTDHIDEVQFEKLSTEFPVFKQLATYNTNSGLIRSMKSYISKNQNSKDPVVQNKIKKQIEFLEDLKLRIDTPTGRVGSKEVLAAVDRQAGTLPNFLAQLKALNIKLPAKAKAALLGIGGGLGATTLASAGPIEETGTTALDKAKSWPIEHPWLTGGAATGAAATTKKGRSILGKAFRILGTPLAGPLFAGWNISDELKKGKSLTEAVTHPLTGIELAFPSLFKENVAKITKSPTLQKVLGLGGAQRFLGPIGMGITAVDILKERTKGMMKESDRMSTLEGDEQEQAIEDYAAKAYRGYASGGLTRTVAPDSGPMSQGLRSLYNNVKKS